MSYVLTNYFTMSSFSRDWSLHRWTPYVKHFPDSHTGVAIKLKIEDMICALGLNEANILKFVVNDNAANAVCAIKLSPDLNQVSFIVLVWIIFPFKVLCANHTLQLAINDTFEKTAVAGSEMTTVLKKTCTLANFVKRSGPATLSLKAACKEEGVPYTTLKNPNQTRWNSKYSNIASVLKLKIPLLKLANSDTAGVWTGKMLSPSEWKLAEGAAKVLQIPLIVTKVWEAEITPTSNLVISELYGMKKRLEAIVQATDCRWE